MSAAPISFDDLDDTSVVSTGKTARELKGDHAKLDVAAGVSLGSGRSVERNINQVAQFNCDKCAGSGRFYSYSGRYVGPCVKCRGKGKLKTDPAIAAARRKAREDAKNAARAAWLEAHPEVVAWINKQAGRFDFATSMSNAIAQYGALTDGQLAAVNRCIERDKTYEAEQAAKRAARVEAAPVVAGEGFARMIAAFAAAKASGLKYPKFHVGPYVFKPASANSKNAGSIYITNGGTYLGKITDGKFIKIRDCSAEDEAEIIRICQDPFAAAVLHGKQTGKCACCGRELENEESVQLGIGPICRRKWGL